MKQLTLSVFVLLVFSCTNIKNLRVTDVPVFTEQTYWLSQQFLTESTAQNYMAAYISQVKEITPTHYQVAVSLKDQPQVAYTVRLRRSDLAIDGFVSAGGDSLRLYLPVLSFPLFKGKSWTATLRTQEHPRRPVKEIPATFEVKDVVSYDYLPHQKIAGEKKAFLIELTLPDRKLRYHYIAPTKKFPGTNLIDLYLQLDLNNPNAPEMSSQCVEYMR